MYLETKLYKVSVELRIEMLPFFINFPIQFCSTGFLNLLLIFILVLIHYF